MTEEKPRKDYSRPIIGETVSPDWTDDDAVEKLAGAIVADAREYRGLTVTLAKAVLRLLREKRGER